MDISRALADIMQALPSHADDAPGASAVPSSFPTNPPAGTEITALPGFSGQLPSRHFGGYLSVDGGNKHLYYYLATSTANASRDPLVLW